MNKENQEEILATVHTLLVADGANEAAALLRLHPTSFELTGHDNWNGGTDLWDLNLQVPAKEFARLKAKRAELETQINAQLKAATDHEDRDWYSAKIVPAKERGSDWRSGSNGISKQIRLNIIDGLRLENVAWHGKLNEVEFLSRLYDLQQLPSTDFRCLDAAADIWQHCINNQDWDQEWVFRDERFDLIHGSAERFLRFLCEVVHPIVRPYRKEAAALVAHFNEQLLTAGWELYEEELIAGRPRFAYRKYVSHPSRAVLRAKNVADALDAGWMANEISRLEKCIDQDPALAIGTSKELVETCCKTILSKRGVSFTKSEDLGDLTKKITKELRLVPEGISDEAKGADNIRLILRNLTQLTHNLAQLRGLYGTGHGRDGKYRGLQPRHARLAVASAVAFIEFVTETYALREEESRQTLTINFEEDV